MVVGILGWILFLLVFLAVCYGCYRYGYNKGNGKRIDTNNVRHKHLMHSYHLRKRKR